MQAYLVGMVRFVGSLRMAVVALVAMLSCSCSLLLSKPPTDAARRGEEQPDCGSSAAPPVLDSVAAGLDMMAFVLTNMAAQAGGASGGEGASVAVAFALPLILFGGSAAYGFTSMSRCRRAERKWKQGGSWTGSSAPGPTAGTTLPPIPSYVTGPSPKGAAGFEFSSSPETAQELCTGAGFSWTGEGSRFECSGSPESTIPLPGPATLRFCDGDLCIIGFRTPGEPPSAASLVQAFGDVRAKLERRFGAATTRSMNLPKACAGPRLLECVRSGLASASATWLWANRWAVHLSMPVSPGAGTPVGIQVLYMSPAGYERVRTQGF